MTKLIIELDEEDAVLLFHAWSDPDFQDASDEARLKRLREAWVSLYERIGAALLAT